MSNEVPIYQPLPGLGFIRLLVLQEVSPDDDDDTSDSQSVKTPLRFHCSLRVFDLAVLSRIEDRSERPDYAALSYTWGCPYAEKNFELDDVSDSAAFNGQYTQERTVPIRCDHGSVLVTPNMYEALCGIYYRYFAMAGSDSTQSSERGSISSFLWIDAICINQGDIEERSKQVAIMDKIYQAASRVIVWLGNQLPRTNRALELLTYLAAISNDQIESMAKEPLYRAETCAKLGMRLIDLEDWRILTSFLERQWFRRVWIIQEFCTARGTTFLCGVTRIPWINLFMVSRMLKITGWAYQLFLIGPALDLLAENQETSDFMEPGIRPQSLQDFKDSLRFSQGQQEEDTNVDLNNLSRIIQSARAWSATDPRDRVYALLPIINSCIRHKLHGSEIIPDYRQNIIFVYTNATFCAIETDQNLAILTMGCEPSLRRMTDLPSWALDFSMLKYPQPLKTYDYASPLDNGLFQMPVLENSRELHLRGACVDFILDMAVTFELFDSGQVSSWLSLAARLKMPYCSGESRTEVLWRTLITNTALGNTPALPEYGFFFVYTLLERLLQRSPVGTKNNSTKGAATFEEQVKATRPIPLEDSSSIEKEKRAEKGVHDIIHFERLDPQGSLPDRETLQELISVLLWWDVKDEKIKEKREEIRESAKQFTTELNSSNGFRRLFITTGNLLGLGPRSLAKDDTVWLFSGCNVPIILRKLENGHFAVIGEAYIHGVMRGEASKIRDIQLQEIVLE